MIHSGLQFKCSQCEFITNTKDNLGIHINVKHLEEKHYYSKCEYVSQTKRNLNDHVKKRHEER